MDFVLEIKLRERSAVYTIMDVWNSSFGDTMSALAAAKTLHLSLHLA